MSRHAFILGGTGQIGHTVAGGLLAAGWNVTVAHRGIHPRPAEFVERGVRIVVLDRDNPGDLPHALASGTDALLDTTALNADHARTLRRASRSFSAMLVG